jgi:hypothetical protein
VLELSLQLDPARVAAVKARLGTLPRSLTEIVRLEIKGGLNRAGQWMVANKLTGGTTADRLARRSGQLIRALNSEVTIEGVGTGDATVRGRLFIREKAPVGSRTPAHVYAPVHEYGATIRPVRAQVLTIPISDEARKRRSPGRFSRRQTFWAKTKRGHLILFWRRNKKADPEPIFLGVRSVRIPARPFMRPTGAMWLPEIARRIYLRTRALVTQRPGA